MSIRLDERRYAEELKRLVADFRMWKNPLVPLPDGFEDDLVWRSYRVFGQTSPPTVSASARSLNMSVESRWSRSAILRRAFSSSGSRFSRKADAVFPEAFPVLGRLRLIGAPSLES